MIIGARLGLPIGKATRNAFGEALRDLGRTHPEIVVVDGDVNNSTRTGYFAKEFPDRFFNVGIAESNMVGVAAGLAATGKTAVVSSFACFIMCNAFDQLRMSVAFPSQNVKVVGSHAGISIGEDGPSQMGIEDVALALALPGFTVFCPADEHAARAITRQTQWTIELRDSQPAVGGTPDGVIRWQWIRDPREGRNLAVRGADKPDEVVAGIGNDHAVLSPDGRTNQPLWAVEPGGVGRAILDSRRLVWKTGQGRDAAAACVHAQNPVVDTVADVGVVGAVYGYVVGLGPIVVEKGRHRDLRLQHGGPPECRRQGYHEDSRFHDLFTVQDGW